MRVSWQAAIALAFTVGCSGSPGALYPPRVNAASAAKAALRESDRDGDGKLSKQEWSASPVLAAVAKRYDTNGDSMLDVAEIRQGIEEWQANAVGPRSVSFTVRLDGRPLPGATVRLVPASFFGPDVKEASDETGPNGGGHLTMAPEDMPKHAPKIPLVQPGLYRVEIRHPSRNVPARYNTETTLGIEITSSNPGPEGIVWSLSTK